MAYKLLYVGRLVPFKHVEDIFKAARLLKKDYALTIIGDGPLMEDLRAKAPKNTKFLGNISNKEVIKQMKNHDMLLLPSDTEPFGRVILEAMQQGLPIISTNCGGPKDIITNGRNGYLVKVGDFKDIADKIHLIMKSKSNIKKNNLLDIKRYYWKNILPKYESLYKRVVKEWQTK